MGVGGFEVAVDEEYRENHRDEKTDFSFRIHCPSNDAKSDYTEQKANPRSMKQL